MLTTEEKIERLKNRIKKLEQELMTDELTKIYNRKGFNILTTPIEKAVRYTRNNPGKRRKYVVEELSILLLDIDHFKKVNDTYGHPIGDMVLVEVASRLKKSVRDTDIVARWGGEEMIVALVGASVTDAASVAEKIRGEIANTPVSCEGNKLTVTASIGVACLDANKELNQVINEADEKLYKAKNSGRNRVEA